MKSVRVPAVFLATFSLACMCGGIEQDPSCADYLACAAEAEPETVGALEPAYGEAGTCWEEDAVAEDCAAACESALEALAEAYPYVEPCSGVAGCTAVSGEWSADFTLEETNGFGCPHFGVDSGGPGLWTDDWVVECVEGVLTIENAACSGSSPDFECERDGMFNAVDGTVVWHVNFTSDVRATGTYEFQGGGCDLETGSFTAWAP